MAQGTSFFSNYLDCCSTPWMFTSLLFFEIQSWLLIIIVFAFRAPNLTGHPKPLAWWIHLSFGVIWWHKFPAGFWQLAIRQTGTWRAHFLAAIVPIISLLIVPFSFFRPFLCLAESLVRLSLSQHSSICYCLEQQKCTLVMWCLYASSKAWLRFVFQLMKQFWVLLQPLCTTLWMLIELSFFPGIFPRASRTLPVTAFGATGHPQWSAVGWPRWPSVALMRALSSACPCPVCSPSGSAGKLASTSTVRTSYQLTSAFSAGLILRTTYFSFFSRISRFGLVRVLAVAFLWKTI